MVLHSIKTKIKMKLVRKSFTESSLTWLETQTEVVELERRSKL